MPAFLKVFGKVCRQHFALYPPAPQIILPYYHGHARKANPGGIFSRLTDVNASPGQAAGAEFKDTWTLQDVDIAWFDLIEAKYAALNRVMRGP